MSQKNRRLSRGGRPRKDGDRHPNGELKSIRDYGTPELQQKRRAAVGDGPTEDNPKKGDTSLSTCPLDVAIARGLVDDETEKVANDFGRWYRMIYGKAHAKAANLTGAVSGEEPSEDALFKAKAKLESATAVLMMTGRVSYDAVVNFVVYERYPKFLLNNREPQGAEKRLFEGLKALADWRRGEQRRAA